MSSSIYTDRSTGTQKKTTLAVSVEQIRVDSDGGADHWMALVRSGDENVQRYVDIDDAIANVIDGRLGLAPKGVTRTRLTADVASGGVTLTVISSSGFVVGTPVAIVAEIDGTVDYATPTAIPDGTSITIPAANEGSLGTAFKTGAYVLSLGSLVVEKNLSSLSYQGLIGVKATLEGPQAPTVTATDGGTQEIYVSIALAGDASRTEKYVDVYVFAEATGVIREHMVPSLANSAVTADPVVITGITTYWNNSTKVLTALTAGTWFVYAVAKDRSGFSGQIQSPPSDADEVTIA